MKIRFVGVISSLVFALSVHAQTSWNASTGGDWDLAGNWNPAVIPNGVGADVRITNLTTSGEYIISASVPQDFTVGRLDFGTNTANVDLDMLLDANVSLIFDVTTGSAQLNLATGGSGSTMTIDSSIQLNDNLTSTSVRNGGTQVTAQFTGAINLQGNTWTVSNTVQPLRFDGLISGSGGGFIIANPNATTRQTFFNNTASTFSGGVSIQRAATVQLSSTNGNYTATGGGGILGTGTISVASDSTTNDNLAATINSNGAFFTNDYTDTTTNVLGNTLDIASGRVLRIDTGNRPMNFGDADGDLTGSGRLVKVGGQANGPRQLALNFANTGFTGVVEIQDGQIQTRVTNALATGSTIVFNPQNSTNGVALQGGMASGAAVTIGSNLDFQRTASGHVQFISTSGNSTFEITGNFSNSGTGTAGYIGVGRGNNNNTVGNGGFSVGTNTGNATIILSGTGTLENNVGIVDGTSTQSILRLANTSGAQTFSGVISGNGDLVRNGVGGTTIVSGINTYNGTTTVRAGRLDVDGTHGAASVVGAYAVNGGILGGNGAIRAGSGSAVAIAATSSAMITGGASGIVGNLKLDGGATTGAILSMATGTTFTFDIGATADKISFWNYAGAADFVRNNNLIDLADIGSAGVGTYTLFDFYSDGGTTPTASGITDGLALGVIPAGWSANLVFNSNSIDLQLNAVPEPATVALIATGLAAVTLFRRRRNS